MNNTQIEKSKANMFKEFRLYLDNIATTYDLSEPQRVHINRRLDEIFESQEKEIQENYVSKEEANKNMRELCQMILDTDKTPRYSYGSKGKNVLNNRGKLAGTGQRWKTPYEIAEDEIRLLEKYINNE